MRVKRPFLSAAAVNHKDCAERAARAVWKGWLRKPTKDTTKEVVGKRDQRSERHSGESRKARAPGNAQYLTGNIRSDEAKG